MGAFDSLEDQNGLEWQTKDFIKPHQDWYRITREGYLEKRDIVIPLGGYKIYPEAFNSIVELMKNPPSHNWRTQSFSGTLTAMRSNTEGEIVTAKFDFDDGRLVRATYPSAD